MSGLACRDARNLFDSHLNGELSPALETELNVHRLSCSACRHELALLEVAGQVMATDDAVPPLDDDFTRRLLACVAVKPKPTSYRRRLIWQRFDRQRILRLGLRGLAVAACLALGVVYFNRPEDIAGVRQVPTGTVGRSVKTPRADAQSASREESPEQRFQAQLERALTGWRKDASSLRRVYDFITPQIIEEMGLDSSEGVHEPYNRFEPAEPNPPDADHEIEDI